MNERNDMQAKLGTTDRRHTILIIGISRGIGRGLAAEYLRRGWFVIGTVRSSTVAPELASARAFLSAAPPSAVSSISWRVHIFG